MKSLFEEINDRLLGKPGRGIVAFLVEYKKIFLFFFALYGLLLLYSKIIYMYYIPSKIKKIINDNPDLSVEQVYEEWKKVKCSLPWFVMIPSKNEMWIKPLNKSDGHYQMLFFNKKTSYSNELDMLIKIYANLKGDFTLG